MAWLAIYAPMAAIVVALGLGSIPFAPAIATYLAPRSPLQAACVAMLVVLPLSPFYSSVSGVPAIARFSIAGVVVALVVLRKIPLARSVAPANVVLLAFVAYQVVPVVAAPDLGYGLLRAANWLMFVPLAFVSFERSDVNLLIRWFAVVGLVLMGGVLLQAVGVIGGTWGGLSMSGAVSATNLTRFTSFISNPNDLGLYLVVMNLGLIAVFLWAPVSKGIRTMALSMAAIGAVCAMATGSRGALLGYPVGLLVIVVMSRGRVGFRIAAIGIAALVVALAASQFGSIGAGQVVGSLGDIVAGQDTSASSRVDVWSVRLHDFGGAVLGAGFGGYGASAFSTGDVLGQRHQTYLALTVDNSWLKLLLEEGLFGVMLLGSVFGMTLASVARVAQDRERGAIAIGAAAMLAVIWFRSISADVFDINPWNGLMWMLVGLAASFSSSSTRSEIRQ
jgi:O-antigen ligase